MEFQHVKPGKGAAFVRVKMKNVITGAVTETTFNPNDKYPTAFIERKKMEYSYADRQSLLLHGHGDLRDDPRGPGYSGQQLPLCQGERHLHRSVLQGQRLRRRGSQLCGPDRHQRADPGVKGDTATNVTKPATVETGAEIKVPLFINEGDRITIDTRTGEYLGRAKS